MAKHNVIAIDIAKNVFQVCGMNSRQKITFNKSLKRKELAAFMMNQPLTTVAMEACYSSHYWGRCFEAMGHHVKLLPAQHVTPFVRGNKSDHNDDNSRNRRDQCHGPCQRHRQWLPVCQRP
jgi:transposase